MFLEKIKKLLNKVYRVDEFVNALLTPVGNKIYFFFQQVDALYCNFFFDTLNEDGCNYFEKLLKITPEPDDTLENRRAKIQAKWLSNNHNCIALIQRVCDSWKNGETAVDFKDGKIQINFIGNYGIPARLDSLSNAINEIKPAHIPFIFNFKYLLIEDIHEVKTLEELQSITIENFALGKD